MASFFDRIKLPSAAVQTNRFDLSCQSILTTDWMRIQPMYYRNLIPGQSITISPKVFARLLPMPTPTFGRGKMHLRAFFVPFSACWKKWNDFINDTEHTNADGTSQHINVVPQVHRSAFQRLFLDTNMPGGGLVELDSAIGNWSEPNSAGVSYLTNLLDIYSPRYIEDIYTKPTQFVPSDTYYNNIDLFYYQTDNPNNSYFGVQLNSEGRRILSILNSLGYRFDGYNYNPSIHGGSGDIAYSALPLLALLRIYLDYYYPSAYVGDTRYNILNRFLSYNTYDEHGQYLPFEAGLGGQYEDVAPLTFFFESLVPVYDSDYFTSAFDNPSGPNQQSNGSSNYRITDVNVQIDNNYPASVSASNTSDGDYFSNTAYVSGKPGDPLAEAESFTQYTLNSLQRLSAFLKRNQYAGSRYIDRFLARFGVQSTPDSTRAYLFGSQDIDLQIRSVEATANTDSSNLGDYAGQGVFRDESSQSFSYKANDFGIVIIINTIVPRIGYYQGVDPQLRRMTRLDMYTPEFDALGTEPIETSELVGNFRAAQSPYGHIWAFKPRYADYKVARDFLSGDFMIPSLSVAGDTSDSWHLFRTLNNQSRSGLLLGHSKTFMQGDDAEQYDRLFYERDTDHFVIHSEFDVTSEAPMRQLYDSIDLDQAAEGTRHQEVSIQSQGTKVN